MVVLYLTETFSLIEGPAGGLPGGGGGAGQEADHPGGQRRGGGGGGAALPEGGSCHRHRQGRRH